MINIYAPNNSLERFKFFTNLESHFTKRTLLLGDFNSVMAKTDRLSGNLDATSQYLSDLLTENSFEEISGSHRKVFSYHHLSTMSRKS